MIYFDHAATAPLRPEARAAMEETFDLFGNPSSVHSAGMQAASRLREARRTVAALLGCLPEELIFTSGGTEANAIALQDTRDETGVRDSVCASAFEHDSVCKNLPSGEGACKLLPVDADGRVDLQKASALIDGRTRLVSVLHVQNELGTVQPIRELGTLCRAAGVLFHTDAVQSVGHTRLCLRELPIDLLSLSAHKFGGPKGVGALYCRQGVRLTPSRRGGMQESGRRAGTESLTLIAGMAAALQAALRDAEEKRERLIALRAELEAGLRASGGRILCENAERMPGFVSVCFPGRDANALLHTLDLYGICVSAGSACHAASATASRSLLSVGLTEAEANATLRITLGEENTRQEIGYFLQCLTKIRNNQSKEEASWQRN